MVIAILLLVILFIAGLININLYLPSKKLYAYLESLFIRTDYTSKVSHQESTGGTGSFDSDGQKRSQLKSVFAMFDKNGDGYITKQELRDSLKNMRIIMSEKEVDEMVVKVDSNGDGLIDFDEFCVLCESISTGPEEGGLDGMEEDELKEAFDVFDKDKDGLISVEELSLVLSCLGMKEGKSQEDCKEMIRKVDLDGDGMVNFDEFKKMMRNGTKVF